MLKTCRLDADRNFNVMLSQLFERQNLVDIDTDDDDDDITKSSWNDGRSSGKGQAGETPFLQLVDFVDRV